MYRKTAATMLDEAGLTARQIANQMGHCARISMTQDVYMARKVGDPRAAQALDSGLGQLFDEKRMYKGCIDLNDDQAHSA